MREPPSEWDCCGNDECVCPYCGAENGDSWELSGDSGITECGTCGRPFSYERCISVDYSTSPIMGPHRQCETYVRSELEHLESEEA